MAYNKGKIFSGISGIYFDHLKACAIDPELTEFKVTICYIPYTTGYSPLAWRKVINMIIEKKGKGNLVQDLRTTNLMEEEFNYNNKILAWEVIRCAEENKQILREQYSSCKNDRAIY